MKKLFLFGIFPFLPFPLLFFYVLFTQLSQPILLLQGVGGVVVSFLLFPFILILIGYEIYNLLAKKISPPKLLIGNIILFVLSLSTLFLIFRTYQGDGVLFLFFPPVFLFVLLQIVILLMSIGAIPYGSMKVTDEKNIKWFLYFMNGIICLGLLMIIIYEVWSTR